MAYSANKTSLSYQTATNGAFVQIPNLMEVPEFGGTPEKIDVTTLGDRSRRYIAGIRDYGDLVFRFLYDNSDEGNFRIMQDLSKQNKASTFQLTYPDGTGHEFKAQPSVQMDAGTVSGALTFRVTMLLQSDVKITNGDGVAEEPVKLPPGVLKMRTLSPEEYSVQENGAIQTQTITSGAFCNIQGDEASHSSFFLSDYRYGERGHEFMLQASHPVVTAQMRHAALNHETWHEENLAIPQNAVDIANLVFYVSEHNSGRWLEIKASTVFVEPFTVGDFQTHRVYGEFEVDVTGACEDKVVVAYSIIVGARPDRAGDGASLLLPWNVGEENPLFDSGVRFELLQGDGALTIDSIGMQTRAAAENTFVVYEKHFITFKAPLEKGDRVNITAKIKTTKRRLIEGRDDEEIIAISQPIRFQLLRQEQTAQDMSGIEFVNVFSGNTWIGSLKGIRRLALFNKGLSIHTRLWIDDRGWRYDEMFSGFSNITWDIDIEEITVISRT